MEGKVELPEEFASEGTQVVILVPESGEPVRLSQAEERELSEAMEEIRRGEFVDGTELLNELRLLGR